MPPIYQAVMRDLIFGKGVSQLGSLLMSEKKKSKNMPWQPW